MNRVLAVAALLLVAGPAQTQKPQTVRYEDYFTDEALRVELVHTAWRDRNVLAVEAVAVEPVWPGPRRNLIDPTGYGKYVFKIFDKATSALLFSQGYCTLLGEWTTTEEAAQGAARSMSEPLRFPRPKAPVQLVVEGRVAKTGQFVELARMELDPSAYDIPTKKDFDFGVTVLHESQKDLAHTVDVVVVPDGYNSTEIDKMRADAARMTRLLLAAAPFDRHAERLGVRLVEAVSADSGPDEPRKGIFQTTAAGTTFDTFRSPRYLTTPDMRNLKRLAALAPYDTIIVMVNTNRYGGGGIPGWYSIYPSDSEYDEYVLLHEFGHGFAGLGDEYYSSATSYDENEFYAAGVEPWEPNLTIQTERNKIKWGHLIPQGVPLPTPDEPQYDGVVGLFEGGGYKAKGLFRPTRNSKMHRKGEVSFGPVNEAAIEKMIDYLSDQEVRP
jgi:hypothetical protein